MAAAEPFEHRQEEPEHGEADHDDRPGQPGRGDQRDEERDGGGELNRPLVPLDEPLAFAFLCLGLVLYGVVLARFPFGELLTGEGDQWIAGGAAVISGLAAATLVEAVRASGELAGLEHPLQMLDLALWSLSMLWLVVLVAAEVARPRLGYHALRWATVFPLGMYAAMSFLTGTVEGIGAFREIGRWLVWIAFAAWCLAAVGLLRRAHRLLGSAA